MKIENKETAWAFRRMEAQHGQSGHLDMTEDERAAADARWLEAREAEFEARRGYK